MTIRNRPPGRGSTSAAVTVVAPGHSQVSSCAGSIQASNTRSGEAGRRRRSVTRRGRSVIGPLPRGLELEQRLQRVQAPLPEGAQAPDPGIGLGSGRSERWCSRPRTSRRSRPAVSSTRRCVETAASEMSKSRARSVTRAPPPARRARIARRVPSARAAKVRSRAHGPARHLTLRLTSSVTRRAVEVVAGGGGEGRSRVRRARRGGTRVVPRAGAGRAQGRHTHGPARRPAAGLSVPAVVRRDHPARPTVGFASGGSRTGCRGRRGRSTVAQRA